MNLQCSQPWWGEHIFNLALLLLGAIIGFVSALAKDAIDARQARRSFITAVRVELDTISKQIDRSLGALEDSEARSKTNPGEVHFSVLFSRTIFDSQLPRLKNLSDIKILEVVKFYSVLTQVESLGEAVNRFASEYREANGQTERDLCLIRLVSATKVAIEELVKRSSHLESIQKSFA